jgi:hypothetical protein
MKGSKLSAMRVAVLAILVVGLSISAVQAAPELPSPLAYIGPGAGLGFLGSLLAIVMVVFLGLVGLILHPLKLFVRWLRRVRPTGSERA